MCRAPVTFGGGIATEKFSSGAALRLGVEVPALDPLGEEAPLDLGRLVAGPRLELRSSLRVHGSRV